MKKEKVAGGVVVRGAKKKIKADAALLAVDNEEVFEIPESAPLPEHYGMTFVAVLCRAPEWLFVFWEVVESERKALKKNPLFEGYYLSIVVLTRDGDPGAGKFRVLVQNKDRYRYISVPAEFVKKGAFYQVELCATIGGRHKTLAVSRQFKMPGLLAASYKAHFETDRKAEQVLYHNELAQLSGIDELPLPRRANRQNHRHVFDAAEPIVK
jgi:hypothetical protein